MGAVPVGRLSNLQPEVRPMVAYFREGHRAMSAVLCVIHMERIAKSPSADDDLAVAFSQLESTLGDDAGDFYLSHFFVAAISAFEQFLQDYVYQVILKHPMRVGTTTFKLSEILDAGGIEPLVQRAAEKLLNEVMYKKPLEVLTSVCEIMSISQASLDSSWRYFVEAKARRDLGIHNGWRCNSVYLRKVSEAGLITTWTLGDELRPRFEDLTELHIVLRQLVIDISEAVVARHWPESLGSVQRINKSFTFD